MPMIRTAHRRALPATTYRRPSSRPDGYRFDPYANLVPGSAMFNAVKAITEAMNSSRVMDEPRDPVEAMG